jgi:hypothetical protein
MAKHEMPAYETICNPKRLSIELTSLVGTSSPTDPRFWPPRLVSAE